MTDKSIDCPQDPGLFHPTIDREKCEAKGPCVDVCPVDVFEILSVSPTDKAALSWIGRVKLFVHGGRQAHAVRGDRCEACGLCVRACPEQALTLQRSSPK